MFYWMADNKRRESSPPTSAGNDLERSYLDLFQFEIPGVPALPLRPEPFWLSMVPRIVPSVTTSGAYEKPV